MKTVGFNILKIIKLEGDDFVNDCLESFDENVSAIEAEYAITNKSA